MTPEERTVLQQFLSDLQASRGVVKDGDAEAMIASALRQNPDAAYVLVQHAILADQALQAAQQQIEALESQAQESQVQGQSPVPAAVFGGGQVAAPQGGGYGQPGGSWNEPPAPQQSTLQPPALQPPALQSPLAQTSGLGGFLRGAGTLAAGVAGGEFLAQGLSNLFSPRDW